MKKRIKLLLAGLVGAVIGLLIAFGWAWCHSEAYCFWNPSIDTVYAEGFSEDDFSKISVGMTLTEVEAIMSPPLSVGTNLNGVVRVFYTRDAKAPFGDFAWFGRSLYVSNGIVTEVESRIYYD